MDQSIIRSAAFATTHWTVVLNAGDPSSPAALPALTELCRTYWYPLYAYARGRGHTVQDAQDLTQEFFYRLLEKNFLGIADRSKGRFRWFLLTAFKGFLANQFDREHAQKRGGGSVLLSLDFAMAEQQFGLEPRSDESPDRIFDRRWALTLLEHAQARLSQEYSAAGKAVRYCELEDFLPGDRSSAKTYAEAGAAVGASEAAVKVEVHRMKKRFGEILRDEIAHTVASAEEIEEEIRYLMSVTS